ncbi:MAG: NAD(P)H-dependent oxidoreductase subunit E [bacterium]
MKYIPQKREARSVRDKIEEDVLIFLDETIQNYGKTEDALIQVLQSVNREFKFLPEVALKYISEEMEVPLSHVYHLATFYDAFSLVPIGEHLIRVCMGTACHARGAPEVMDRIENILEIRSGETTSDGKFTLQMVRCVGCCALGPVVVIDENYHQMAPDNVEKILKSYT